MAFRASTQIVTDSYASLKRQAFETRRYLVARTADLQAATSPATYALSIIQHFAAVIPQMTAWAATPGLAEYAKAQVADPNYDVVAEFQTMMAAMVACRDQLITMFPKDGSGFLLYQTLNANGTFTIRTFTAAQLAPVVALVDSVIATIS